MVNSVFSFNKINIIEFKIAFKNYPRSLSWSKSINLLRLNDLFAFCLKLCLLSYDNDVIIEVCLNLRRHKG